MGNYIAKGTYGQRGPRLPVTREEYPLGSIYYTCEGVTCCYIADISSS